MEANLGVSISFFPVLKALNFAFSVASLLIDTAIIDTQYTTQTKDGEPVRKVRKYQIHLGDKIS